MFILVTGINCHADFLEQIEEDVDPLVLPLGGAPWVW